MGNVHMEATQINYREGNKKMSVAQAIKNAGSEITPEEKEWIDTIPELASQEIIAPEFDAEAGVYAVGDLVMHEGKLYEFTSAHETAGDWNSEEVSEKTVADEIGDVKSGLTNLENRRFYSVTKQATTDNVTLTITANEAASRYCGILLINENSGYHAIYAIMNRMGISGKNEAIKLAGDDFTVIVDGTNGNISVPVQSAWSRITLWTDNPVEV